MFRADHRNEVLRILVTGAEPRGDLTYNVVMGHP